MAFMGGLDFPDFEPQKERANGPQGTGGYGVPVTVALYGLGIWWLALMEILWPSPSEMNT